MTEPDLYLPCPRCKADCPAWVRFHNRREGTITYQLYCEAHKGKQVTL